MPAFLRVRALTLEETTVIHRLAQSRTEAARLVQRAKVIWLSYQGYQVAAIADDVACSQHSVRMGITRFNAAGVEGLRDQPRAGRPVTYPPEQVRVVIETALTNPDTLGLPFAWWTLDRLEAFLHEHKQIGMQRSRIDELLIQEGVRWRMQETWFRERVAPAFAEKRGPSSRATRRRLRLVS